MREVEARAQPASTAGQREPSRRAPAWLRPVGGSLGRAIKHDVLRRRLLACADGVAVIAAAVAAGSGGGGVALAFALVVLLPGWILLAKLHGLYDQDHRALRHLTVDELPNLLSWVATGTAGGAALTSLVTGRPVAVGPAARFWLVLLVAAPLARSAARRLWRAITPPETTILLGSGPLEAALRRKIELFGDIHLDIVATLDSAALHAIAGGGAPDHQIAAAGRMPDRLILATADVTEPLIASLVRWCKSHRVKLSVVPPARGLFGTAVRLSHVADLPFIEYHTWDPSRSTMLLKRTLDAVLAALLLMLLAPMLALVAVCILLDSRGPVLFRQVRVGRDGRPFRMVKFRTMRPDAERRLATLVDLDRLEEPVFKLRQDPRVTRVGRVLRRWSLDELPQLLNVLRGDMSIVGPRPEEVAVVDRYRPEHRFRLAVKPGMTGPMQVYGRGELTFDERLAVEREYIENVSLGRDVRIMLLTLPAVLSGKGAF